MMVMFKKALSLLRDHPGLDVNWANGDRWTALHCAAWEGHVNVVKVLLTHPHININVRDTNDATPFLLGCDNGGGAVVRVLQGSSCRCDAG